MWNWIWILIVVVLACLIAVMYLRSSRSQKPHSVVSLLGGTREQVRKEFGVPGRAGAGFDSFFSHGLVFDYTAGRVMEITASHFQSGEAFSGEILGAHLGDSKNKCLSVWGEASREEDSGFEYSVVSWDFEGYCLELEIWKEDGKDKGFGAYRKDTVKRIKISQRAR